MRAKTSRRLNQQPTDSSARQAGLPDQQRTLANTATRPLQASTWQPDYSRQSRNISQSGHTGRGFNFANIAIVSPNNPVQAKLTIGQPNDKYEQEADRIAEQVVGMPDTAPAQPAAAGNNFIQRQENKEDEEEETLQTKPLIQRQMGNEEEEEEEETLQADSMPGASATTAPGISAGINALRGRGEPLAAETRHFMEPRFGQDFSQVRVHTGDHAAQLTRQINARAFTVGSDIAFGAGQYQPNSING
ncbi:MAG: DUF4157 domain-containing protein, partial [Gammaproteobacteria bacterium]|nr:DUF4157 domain-containing protein [Gammaproteobacteria bacterium]